MEGFMARFEDEASPAQIEKIVWLAAGVLSENSVDRVLGDFFEDETSVKGCFPDIHDHLLEAVDDRDYYEVEMLLADAEKFGFLVKFNTPRMKVHGAWASFSWSEYYVGRVYGETLDEAVEKGFAWVDARREEDRASGDDLVAGDSRGVNEPR
jgi:hypothetical protein